MPDCLIVQSPLQQGLKHFGGKLAGIGFSLIVQSPLQQGLKPKFRFVKNRV